MRISDLHRRILAGKKDVLLLDILTDSVGAYSIRKTRSAYTGDCIEVRRSSDNALQNIGFINNVLDTSSLLSFVGSGDGFVKTWYDQSFLGLNNAVQNNNINQPRIVFNGNLETTVNGKTTLNFFSKNQWFTLNTGILGNMSLFTNSLQKFSIISVFQVNSGIGGTLIGKVSVLSARTFQYAFDPASVNSSPFLSFRGSTGFSTSTTPRLDNGLTNYGFIDWNADNAIFSSNLNVNQNISVGSSLEQTANIIIGARTNGTVSLLDGKISEIIFFDESKRNQFSVINENLREYYGI
jgi:hypothetical protein